MNDQIGMPVPPPAPPGNNRKAWIIAAVAAGVIVILGASVSISDNSTPVAENDRVVVTEDSQSCVEGTAASNATLATTSALQEASDAIAVYDITGAIKWIRRAAEGTRQILPFIHNEPEIETLITLTADSYDESADQLEAGNIQASTQALKDARDYTDAATEIIGGGSIVDCGDL